MKKILNKKIILLLTGILFIIDFYKYDIGIPCIFHLITGFYCPGCGGTRAIKSILHLDFYQAFRYNALVTVLIPFTIIFLIYKYIFNGKRKIPNSIWIFLLIIVILFGIIRNIYIFNFLAPITIM